MGPGQAANRDLLAPQIGLVDQDVIGASAAGRM
jgi:hypothetical protein